MKGRRWPQPSAAVQKQSRRERLPAVRDRWTSRNTNDHMSTVTHLMATSAVSSSPNLSSDVQGIARAWYLMQSISVTYTSRIKKYVFLNCRKSVTKVWQRPYCMTLSWTGIPHVDCINWCIWHADSSEFTVLWKRLLAILESKASQLTGSQQVHKAISFFPRISDWR